MRQGQCNRHIKSLTSFSWMLLCLIAYKAKASGVTIWLIVGPNNIRSIVGCIKVEC